MAGEVKLDLATLTDDTRAAKVSDEAVIRGSIIIILHQKSEVYVLDCASSS